MAETVLSVEALTVYRGTYAAVQNVSFTLRVGTNVAIIGPNGAGKTTLIQAILGILPRQTGRIMVLGEPLTQQGKLPRAIRQQLAYLPQQFRFDHRIPLTVAELVGLGWDRLTIQIPWVKAKQCRAAVREALARVDVWYLREQLLSSLSGGEIKRVLLAYCLVQPRRLLILDEAPAGLDVRNEWEFYQLLDQLKQEEGWTILQISHDLEQVRRHCDRVLCLNRTLRCQGQPDAILSASHLT